MYYYTYYTFTYYTHYTYYSYYTYYTYCNDCMADSVEWYKQGGNAHQWEIERVDCLVATHSVVLARFQAGPVDSPGFSLDSSGFSLEFSGFSEASGDSLGAQNECSAPLTHWIRWFTADEKLTLSLSHSFTWFVLPCLPDYCSSLSLTLWTISSI